MAEHAHRHPSTHDHDAELRSMRTATALNALIFTTSLISGVMTGSSASVSEAIHDGTDALTHGLDATGHNAKSERLQRRLRQASAVGITGVAAYFSYKYGIEMFEGDDETTTDATLYAGAFAVAVNYYIHKNLHAHDHSHGETNLNLAASKVHAKVDAVVSPMLLVGIALARHPELANADDIAACLGSVATVLGNGGETVRAFTPQPTHSEAA